MSDEPLTSSNGKGPGIRPRAANPRVRVTTLPSMVKAMETAASTETPHVMMDVDDDAPDGAFPAIDPSVLAGAKDTSVPPQVDTSTPEPLAQRPQAVSVPVVVGLETSPAVSVNATEAVANDDDEPLNTGQRRWVWPAAVAGCVLIGVTAWFAAQGNAPPAPASSAPASGTPGLISAVALPDQTPTTTAATAPAAITPNKPVARRAPAPLPDARSAPVPEPAASTIAQPAAGTTAEPATDDTVKTPPVPRRDKPVAPASTAAASATAAPAHTSTVVSAHPVAPDAVPSDAVVVTDPRDDPAVVLAFERAEAAMALALANNDPLLRKKAYRLKKRAYRLLKGKRKAAARQRRYDRKRR